MDDKAHLGSTARLSEAMPGPARGRASGLAGRMILDCLNQTRGYICCLRLPPIQIWPQVPLRSRSKPGSVTIR